MRKKKKLVIFVIALAITILGILEKNFPEIGPDQINNSSDQTVNRRVVQYLRHVDGETTYFSIDGVDTKVRYLAIDTQETVHPTKEATQMGYTASEYVKERLENANTIEIEFDQNSDHLDKYGRTLAWIWVDGILFQKELVEDGLAEVKYIYGDYKYLDELYEAQDDAKSSKLGIWK